MNDGAMNDGAMNDGAMNDGAMNDGAMNDYTYIVPFRSVVMSDLACKSKINKACYDKQE